MAIFNGLYVGGQIRANQVTSNDWTHMYPNYYNNILSKSLKLTNGGTVTICKIKYNYSAAGEFGGSLFINYNIAGRNGSGRQSGIGYAIIGFIHKYGSNPKSRVSVDQLYGAVGTRGDYLSLSFSTSDDAKSNNVNTPFYSRINVTLNQPLTSSYYTHINFHAHLVGAASDGGTTSALPMIDETKSYLVP